MVASNRLGTVQHLRTSKCNTFSSALPAALLIALLPSSDASGDTLKAETTRQVRVEVNGGGPSPIVIPEESADGNIDWDDLRADAAPSFENVHAYSGARTSFHLDASLGSSPGEFLAEGYDYAVGTTITGWATPVNHERDEAEVEAVARAAVFTDYTEQLPFGGEFRYALTWAISKERLKENGIQRLSEHTQVEHRSRVLIDDMVVSGPSVDDLFSPEFDRIVVRSTGVFVRDPDRMGESLPIHVNSDIGLTHRYPPVPPDLLDPTYYDFTQYLSEDIRLSIGNALEGTSQRLAVKPNSDAYPAPLFRTVREARTCMAVFGFSEDRCYSFLNVSNGMWFDPTPASGFTYDMIDDDVVFNEILNFPTGLDGPVTVSVDGQELGRFGPGDSLDFVSVFGRGVSRFDVTGISPYAQSGDSPGFALQLGFSAETASFTMFSHPVFGGPKVILSPTAVLGTDLGTFSADTSLDNMIDQSGLDQMFVSGETLFDVYIDAGDLPLADADYVNYWQSEASFNGEFAGAIDFDLGDAMLVDRLAIWNGTLEEIEVLVATSLEGPWETVGAFTLEDQNPLLYSLSGPAILELGGAQLARYLRVQVHSAYPYIRNETFEYAIVRELAVSASQVIPGDANLDMDVDFADFLILADQFGQAGDWKQGDFDGNGTVAFEDFLILSQHYGATSAAAAETIPEPTHALSYGVMAVIGLRALATRRR